VPLPKIISPEFELELPSNNKKIKYRPFLVKEEKILLLALESKDVKQITNAIKQILKSCIITRGIKVEELPTFDIEYIFLNVRGKSVGENIDLIVTCSDDGETQVPITIFIDEIKVQKKPEHTTDIELGKDLILRMKYPSLEEFIKTNFDFGSGEKSSSNVDKSFDIITSCMDVVFTKEESWSAKDCTKKELMDFIDSMDTKQFKLIEQFFQTMPVLSHTFTVINPKTKVENEVTLEGLTSFFT
jgi:hypothetical protein